MKNRNSFSEKNTRPNNRQFGKCCSSSWSSATKIRIYECIKMIENITRIKMYIEKFMSVEYPPNIYPKLLKLYCKIG